MRKNRNKGGWLQTGPNDCIIHVCVKRVFFIATDVTETQCAESAEKEKTKLLFKNQLGESFSSIIPAIKPRGFNRLAPEETKRPYLSEPLALFLSQLLALSIFLVILIGYRVLISFMAVLALKLSSSSKAEIAEETFSDLNDLMDTPR